MTTFEQELKKATTARAVFDRLKRQDNISDIEDIIASLNEEQAKMVLKLFVYAVV